ncbi:transposase [Paenibacillus sp. D2_2]|uniref:transposase n=1 Tax=Paenibacillus sp. D2_2 TaxID=3073092 RepID=UPI0035C00726
MANKSYYSLAHTKWMFKYHIVFTPKYRRKEIYNQVRKDICTKYEFCEEVLNKRIESDLNRSLILSISKSHHHMICIY